MCSTHNPRKHYFAVRQKVCIRFTFVNQDSLQRSFVIDVSQFQEAGSIQVVKAILHLQSKGFNVDKYDICMPQFDNICLNMEGHFFIHFQKLPKKQLFFHLTYKNTEDQKLLGQKMKQKQPERYIGNVIQKVKYWRGLFHNQKMSLKDAAQIVGIPKKSLDDYYLLLRQGEILCFQFDKNLENKMGQLRSFIKKYSKKLPSGKLPEQMNNLKCYNLVIGYQDKRVKQNDEQIQTFSNKISNIDLGNDCNYWCNEYDNDSDQN